jgi:hypothetical protein
VVLERETEELERQQERQTKVLEAEEAEIQLHMSNKEKAMVRHTLHFYPFISPSWIVGWLKKRFTRKLHKFMTAAS